MDYYRKLEKIGQGTYGIVYKGQEQDGTIYAMKKIYLEKLNIGLPCVVIREISLLKELQHPNIVKLCDVIHSKKSLTLVFEFLDQDLKKLLDVCQGGLDPTVVKSFMFQLLRGVSYCHDHCILHRDLKPQNLLINREGFLKLADFGLARAFRIPVKSYSHQVVTLWYRAPDVLMESKNYSTHVDIWSVGCIFAEMINGYPLFPGTNEQDQLLRIFQILGTPTLQTWLEILNVTHFDKMFQKYDPRPWSSIVPSLDNLGVDLLSKMLHYIPHKRISAKEALQHPYFT
ncbi:cyclin-dependent kinase 2 homolog isoform X2 [Hylaeus volcanicus]|uniref:cyclin-dependent kinase 2 homolog isoform X2 n=1 Tax=Hylaeus volcanicus TaxID=313075 RepID=UPI0023B834DA|nr:cyclin-dependent kinase 2 homolog isoform X2 [Hylaeus volcanicus]